jgi:hypothetical protein
MIDGNIEDRVCRDQLKAAALAYFQGLERGEFDAIPFSENIVFRAPLAPGGAGKPLIGIAELRDVWWAPIQGAISRVEVVDHYINEDATGICTAALVAIAGTDIVLRVADRFTVDAAGRITEQENHFDPRDLTHPGWRTSGTSDSTDPGDQPG